MLPRRSRRVAEHKKQADKALQKAPECGYYNSHLVNRTHGDSAAKKAGEANLTYPKHTNVQQAHQKGDTNVHTNVQLADEKVEASSYSDDDLPLAALASRSMNPERGGEALRLCNLYHPPLATEPYRNAVMGCTAPKQVFDKMTSRLSKQPSPEERGEETHSDGECTQTTTAQEDVNTLQKQLITVLKNNEAFKKQHLKYREEDDPVRDYQNTPLTAEYSRMHPIASWVVVTMTQGDAEQKRIESELKRVEKRKRCVSLDGHESVLLLEMPKVGVACWQVEEDLAAAKMEADEFQSKNSQQHLNLQGVLEHYAKIDITWPYCVDHQHSFNIISKMRENDLKVTTLELRCNDAKMADDAWHEKRRRRLRVGSEWV